MNRFQKIKMMTFAAATFSLLTLWLIEYAVVAILAWEREPENWKIGWKIGYLIVAFLLLALVTDAYREMKKRIVP